MVAMMNERERANHEGEGQQWRGSWLLMEQWRGGRWRQVALRWEKLAKVRFGDVVWLLVVRVKGFGCSGDGFSLGVEAAVRV
ncbi:hypothetical protein RJT34_21903 [Clitoria ternatea]|uniref:Uncharacterized protein n=1 Tax=Clitoria ternatea TaxID=43366 RepID=A0AAN9IV24_CLITE